MGSRRERPILFNSAMVKAILDGRKTVTRRVVKRDVVTAAIVYGVMSGGPGFNLAKCPYGQTGERLWVKETWGETNGGPDFKRGPLIRYEYRANGEIEEMRWRPSIFMPRSASRLTLEVVSVRVERLQEITNSDAEREGVEEDGLNTARQRFGILWDSINDKRGYGWEFNCWVWRIEFRRVKP